MIARHNLSKSNWVLKLSNLDLFLTYILFFPPLLQALGYGGYSPGILICALSLMPIYSKVIFDRFVGVRTFLFSMFILVYACISLFITNVYFSDGPDLKKWALGLIIIISMIILSSVFSYIYKRELITNKIYENKFPLFTAFTIYAHIMLYFRFAEFSPFYLQIDPTLCFFSEPSHIAYITSIFLFIKFFTTTRKMFLIYFISSIYIFISIASLVGLAAIACFAFVIASRIKKILLLLAFLSMVFFSINIDYKLKKNLNFVDEKNISMTAVVYLSGWERAFLNLIETNLMGLGVNQFGVYGDQGYYSEIVILRAGDTGEQVNRFDGSFIFAKLTGEYGILSLFLTAYLIGIWFKCFTRENYMKNYLSLGIICSFFILFFFRSPGLACGASVLMISLITNPDLMKYKIKILTKDLDNLNYSLK